MVPVLPVNVHIGSSLPFFGEPQALNHIQGFLVLRQDKGLDPVHLELVEHEADRTPQSFCDDPLAGIVLIKVVTGGTAHHAAIGNVKERYSADYLIFTLHRDPERHKASFAESGKIGDQEIPLDWNSKVIVIPGLGELLMKFGIADDIVRHPAAGRLAEDR